LKSLLADFMTHHLSTGVIVYLRDGQCHYANEAAAELLGVPLKKLILENIFHSRSGDGAEMLSLGRGTLETGESRECEISIAHESGKWRHAAIRFSLVSFAEDHALVATLSDVTEQRTAEKSVSFLEFAVENAEEMVFSVDYDGRFTYVNDSACRHLGFTRQELLSSRVDRVMDGPSRERVHEAWLRVQKHGTGTFQVMAMRKDGSSFPVEITADYYGLQEQNHVIGFARDVTAATAARQALAATEERYRTMVEATSDAIYSYDLDLRITGMNRAAEAATGVSSDVALGQHLDSLGFPPATLELWMEMTDQVLTERAEIMREVEAFMPDGQSHFYETFLSPIWNAEGEIVGFRGRSQDVTAKRTAEEALRKNEEHLRQVERVEAIGQLAAGVAHDFNNLLTGIMGYSELLLGNEDEGFMSPEAREDVREIRATAERGKALTRHILAYTRAKDVKPARLCLNDAIAGMRELLTRTLGGSIEVDLHLEDGLEDTMADLGQLEQVLMNLAINGRDAMAEGGRLTIQTANVFLEEDFCLSHGCSEPGRYVLLSVADIGCGMDEGTKSRIFEPFFTTKEAGKGTGLGLATVIGIVRQSGGFVAVESEVGSGSTFKVYLPSVEHGHDAPTKRSSREHRAEHRMTTLAVTS